MTARTLTMLLLLLLLPSVAWGTVEALCQQYIDDDAGENTTCICSEPLDFSSANFDSPVDPPDTSASDPECNGAGNAINGGSNASTRMVTASTAGLPVGINGPSHIIEWDMGADTGSIKHEVSGQLFTDKTFCMRVYFSGDENLVGQSSNFK